MSELPLYRTLKEPTFVNGCQFFKGTEVEFAGWPHPKELEPVNEPARRVAKYLQQFGLDPMRKQPRHPQHGRIYLPGVLPSWGSLASQNDDPGRSLPSPVSEADVTPTMPKYRVTGTTFLGPHSYLHEGDVVAWLGWCVPGLLKPANEPAERVQAYFTKYRGHPDLLPSPFCFYADDLFLPQLRELPSPAKRAPADEMPRRRKERVQMPWGSFVLD